jgi:type I restriction enzyme M protein
MVDPHFLADYLRVGFGNTQAIRAFTGSTGLVELTPEDVNKIVVPTYLDVDTQRQMSKLLREAEMRGAHQEASAKDTIATARATFRDGT